MKKTSIWTFFWAALVAAVIWIPGAAAQQFEKRADNFVVLMDVSGSMAREYEPREVQKLALAKEVLREMNRAMPNLGYKAGLYAYTPITPFYPMQPYNQAGFSQAIEEIPDDFMIGGYRYYASPLGEGLRELDSLLDKLQGKTVVYLFSDGGNTSQWDAVEMAQMLDRKYEVCFLVVPFTQDQENMQRLQGIAAVNQCSQLVEFETLTSRSGICDGVLCVARAEEERPEVVGYLPQDNDNDGVPNAQDNCPNTPPGFRVNEQGCLIPASIESKAIHFGFDQWEIQDQDREELQALATFLENHPEATAVLTGYADNIGTDSYNQSLSQRRAERAKEYITQNFNVTPEKVQVKGVGEAPDTTRPQWQNRRVEIEISGAFERQ